MRIQDEEMQFGKFAAFDIKRLLREREREPVRLFCALETVSRMRWSEKVVYARYYLVKLQMYIIILQLSQLTFIHRITRLSESVAMSQVELHGSVEHGHVELRSPAQYRYCHYRGATEALVSKHKNLHVPLVAVICRGAVAKRELCAIDQRSIFLFLASAFLAVT